MEDKLKKHEDLIMVILINKNKSVYTEEEIKQASEQVKIISGADPSICKQAIKNIHTKVNVTMRRGVSIKDKKNQDPWYKMRKSEINHFYWSRYREYLLKIKSFPREVVNAIDGSTDEIMDLLGDPLREDSYKIRGLMIGDVQSGKTATYTAICNKAADAGYKVIILLTGTIENLRRQTQSRIDEGFVGLVSSGRLDKRDQKQIKTGVANIAYKGNKIPAVFTSEIKDFNASLLNSLGMRLGNYSEPSIFVIKKNKRMLENLYTWLKTYNADESIGDRIDLPMIIIDDEADNASVNTRGKDDPTTINRGIRDLLALFTKSNYLGVTATPYANIFINPEEEHDIHKLDLFPENFIYALNTPSNYIGTEVIFGDEGKYKSSLEMINDIDNDIDEFLRFYTKKTPGLSLNELPRSLKEAIYYFIISNGVLDKLSYDKRHRTMLINVSRLKDVHSYFVRLVDTFLRDVVSDINNYCMLSQVEAFENSKHISYLKYIWDLNGFEKKYKIKWQVFQHNLLRKAANPIELREINSNANTKRLNYHDYTDTGARFIAIGGNSLSRGLTLEGLCVSYFYRNSRMYDTLLQMGRWFGYRDGYRDLFRIWMTEETMHWYEYITEATSELKQEICRMDTIGLTPKDFGLRVRQDLSSLLIITARNKMRHTQTFERIFSVAGRLIETPRLSMDKSKLEENYKLTTTLYETLTSNGYQNSGTHKNAKFFNSVPREIIINFLKNFEVEPQNLAFNTDAFIRYTHSRDALKFWDVAFPLISKGEVYSNNLPIKRQTRKIIVKQELLLVNGTKVRVGSGGCTKIGLSRDQIKDIEEAYKNRSDKKVPDSEFLIEGRRPLLLIHILKPNEKSDVIEFNEMPLIALGIGFPKTDDISTALVRYRMNLVGIKNGFFEAEDEGDDYYDVE